MQNIKISMETFEKLKIAAWEENIGEITNILNDIEWNNIKNQILRSAYKNYKINGNKEDLDIYIQLKKDLFLI